MQKVWAGCPDLHATLPFFLIKKTELFCVDEQLIVNAMDLFSAGSETTATTLAWAIDFMILEPQVQGQRKNMCV